jgi:hypothetical protein
MLRVTRARLQVSCGSSNIRPLVGRDVLLLVSIRVARHFEAAIESVSFSAMVRRAIRLLVMLISAAGFGMSAVAADRVALVIGNADYPAAPLQNPINDARAMAEKLTSVGFDVIKVENATLAQMNRAIVKLTDRLTNEGAVVFYFAGHGMQLRGKNFLLPVDAVTTSEASVRNTAYDFDQLMDSLGESRRTNVIILDACRNNPYSNARGGSRGLAQANAPYGTLISYATSPGLTAADGEGENGLFTSALLRHLGQPATIEEVFKKVRVDVATTSKGEQVPWESSSLVGSFSFVEREADPDVPGAAAFELEYWRSIQGSKNRADYESYLARFPDGQFVDIARNRLAALAVPTPPPEPLRVKTPVPASTANPAPAKSPPPVAQDPLCSKIVERISIGEPVPKDDLAYLRTKCKGG